MAGGIPAVCNSSPTARVGTRKPSAEDAMRQGTPNSQGCRRRATSPAGPTEQILSNTGRPRQCAASKPPSTKGDKQCPCRISHSRARRQPSRKPAIRFQGNFSQRGPGLIQRRIETPPRISCAGCALSPRVVATATLYPARTSASARSRAWHSAPPRWGGKC